MVTTSLVSAGGRPAVDRARDARAQILALIDGLPSADRGRALVLDPFADEWAVSLKLRGFEMCSQADVSQTDLPPGSVDLVLVRGYLERAEWDRWALQQAHRALRNAGHLAIAVPHLYGVGTLGGMIFFMRRAIREVRLRLGRSLGRPAPRERFSGRRYRLAALKDMLESLGYSVEHDSAHQLGWLGAFARFLKQPDAFAGILVLFCRREPSLFGLEAVRPFPDPDEHRARFERVHGSYVRDRDRWLERHPRYRPSMVQQLNPRVFAGEHVLVLAPHPDDELIGCGGTLARLVAAGARVSVIHATDGSEAASLWHATGDERRTVRLDEARSVGELMGFESLTFWKEDNADFHERPERVAELAQVLREAEPALVFTPFVTDVHPDHRVLSRMLAHALAAAPQAAERTRVMNYQVWSLAPHNLYCEINSVVLLQEKALFLYETAMKVDDYVHFCQDRNYLDCIALTGRRGFVEAYFDIDAYGFQELMATEEALNG